MPLLLPIEDFDALPVVVVAPAPGGCGCARCRNDLALPECRADAWEEGRRAGLAERAMLLSGQVAALEGVLAAALRAADAAAAGIAEDTAEAVGRAVIGLAAAALPATFARLGAAEARLVAAAVLPSLRGEAAVTIAAPADVVALLGQIPGAGRQRVTLVERAGDPADISIAWQGGSVERARDAALARAQGVLAEFGLLPAPIDAVPTGAAERVLEELAHG